MQQVVPLGHRHAVDDVQQAIFHAAHVDERVVASRHPGPAGDQRGERRRSLGRQHGHRAIHPVLRPRRQRHGLEVRSYHLGIVERRQRELDVDDGRQVRLDDGIDVDDAKAGGGSHGEEVAAVRQRCHHEGTLSVRRGAPALARRRVGDLDDLTSDACAGGVLDHTADSARPDLRDGDRRGQERARGDSHSQEGGTPTDMKGPCGEHRS